MTPEEWIIWGYRILLGRDPESSALIQHYIGDGFSPDRFCGTVMASVEFKDRFRRLAPLPDLDIQEERLRFLKTAFAVPAGAGHSGFFTDFLGVRTRCSYLPPDYAQYSGWVEHSDGTGLVPLHDPAEMVALLTAVSEARGHLVVAELGAGWGPWLVAGAVAARHMGLNTTLVGVEGDPEHFGFLRTHMRDNGIDPDNGHHLHRAVIGARDGTALFPVLTDPSGNWGAQAVFGDKGQAGNPAAAGAGYAEVPCLSLRTVLQPLDRVDLMHCDIQGAEVEVLDASADELDAKVKRLVIGTHGRTIEEHLLALFPPRGWVLEFEKACVYTEADSRMVLLRDGVQIWRRNQRHH